jgi:pimeloyl-ACP methyl ester carboxylesterase
MLLNESANRSSQRIKLPDGRHLGYAEWGDPQGSPVLLFHGTPGSRYFRHPEDSIIMSLGIRLIIPERPGYGLSDLQPDRKILDWPDDVLNLADALQLERFGIIGYSGGGPHAAACALRIPHRLNGVALVSCPSPFTTPNATNDMVWLNRVLFGLSHESYALARLSWWFMNVAFSGSPDGFMDFLSGLAPESEREILRDTKVRAMMVKDFAEAHLSGINGTAWETALLAREWGFGPEDIPVAVSLWQGTEDVRTPLAMGKLLAATIPNCETRFFPGEGHEVVYRHWTEIILSVLPQKPAEESATALANKKKRRPRSRREAEPARAEPKRARRKTDQVRPPADKTLCTPEGDKDLVSTAHRSTQGK